MSIISIIIPVYNAEKTLDRCLQSILAQEISDIEIICVDNNSTDSSLAIIKKFNRVKPFHCKVQGVSNARNTGLSVAQGKYIFFLDSDDFLCPNALQKLYNCAIKNDADMVSCNYYTDNRVWSNSSDDVIASNSDIPNLFNIMMTTYIMYNPTKLYKREFLQHHNILFDPSLSLGEDLIFNLSVFNNATCICYISEPLYNYTVSSHGLTNKYRKDFINIKLVLADCIKDYLKKNNLPLDNYFIVLFNDVFAMFVNAKKGRIESYNNIFKLPQVIELLSSKVFKNLPLFKKIVFILMKLKMVLPLRLIVTLLTFNNR